MWLYLLGGVVLLAIYKFVNFLSYWKGTGVDSEGLLGQMNNVYSGIFRTKSLGDFIIHTYNQFPNSRFSGTFQFDKPTLILRDPELIKQIAVKDFDHFEDHLQVISEDAEPLWNKNLFQLKGEQWRDMRATLSPAFTSAKMKAMFVLISDCAEQFVQHFHKKNEETISLEMKDTFTRYANDVIASTAFGIKCDSLGQRENEFYMMGKEVTDFTGFKFVKMVIYMMFPFMQKFFGTTIFSKEVSHFFRTLVKDTMQMREEKGIVRPDMIHLLMEAKKGRLRHEETAGNGVEETGFATVEESTVGRVQKAEKPQLSDDDLTAQALLFFFAGFDSVSTLMCFVAYELAVNPDVQEKLQAEIDDTYLACNKTLTYDGLTKMKYLDMIVSETLRKWPAAPSTDRICTKPYTIVPTKPEEKPVELKVGNLIWLPIYGLHHDPQYFPEPKKFDPERFSDENKSKIVHFSYIPFGAGPRNCIGSRFALLEAKAVIFHLLTKFNIVVIKRTPIPVVLSKKHFNMTVENGMWLGLQRRDNLTI